MTRVVKLPGFFFILGLSPLLSLAQGLPIDVKFGDKIMRESRRGDNWCTTWGNDDHQYTSMCDGYGWDANRKREIHTEVLKITGEFGDVHGYSLPAYPVDYEVIDATNRYMPYYFGYGIVDVNGVLFQFLSRQAETNFMPPFQGTNVIYSPDYGESWFRFDDEDVTNTLLDYSPAAQFFWQEDGSFVDGKEGYAFSWISVCQMGKGNSQGEQDGFVYLYSPNGAQANELSLARVSSTSITDRSAYQFFHSFSKSGEVNWTSNIEDRGVAYTFPKENSQGDPFGWYSWLPSVVWNEGLRLYIMVNGGTYSTNNYWDKGHNLHRKSGSLQLYYSKKPWGPWTQFYSVDHWHPAGDPNERTYQPKLSPKWISEDGKEMVLIWSDAAYEWGKTEGMPNYYKWNQMKIELQLGSGDK